MDMQITRKLNYSFLYFLLEELSFRVDKHILVSNDGLLFESQHKNFVVTKPIEVFVDNQKVSSDGYDVYPLLGAIRFKHEVGGTVTASYNYTFINVLNRTESDLIQPPLIAFENNSDSDYSFELGSTLSNIQALYYIHLYSINESQRDDLCDVLKKSLRKTLPVKDFNKGFPLTSDGILRNISIPVVNYATFSNVNIKRNPLESTDEIERGRALISVIFEYVN